MNDLFYEPITKELINKLNLKFADPDIKPEKYDTITITGKGEFIELKKERKYLDENEVLHDNTVMRYFRNNDMTGVYIEY